MIVKQPGEYILGGTRLKYSRTQNAFWQIESIKTRQNNILCLNSELKILNELKYKPWINKLFCNF